MLQFVDVDAGGRALCCEEGEYSSSAKAFCGILPYLLQGEISHHF